MAAPDMDVIKEIPGYKVIMKAVLKSQIQQLVEQLASHTDEESVILTASVSDGTLSHLGSDSGKFFLEDHEDIKSQFLGFCLKRHHRRKQEKEREEAIRNMPPAIPYGMRSPSGPRFMQQRPPRMISPRQNVQPVHLSRVSPGARMRHEPYPMIRPQRKSLNFEQQQQQQGSVAGPVGGAMQLPVSNTIIKIEPEDNSNEAADNNDANTSQNQPQTKSEIERDDDTKSNSSTSTIPNNDNQDVKFSDTQPSGGLSLDSDLSNLISSENSQQSDGNEPRDNTSETDNVGGASVKMEAISEAEMELEITGVEPGRPMVPQDNWGPNTSGFDQSGATGSPGDMQGYNDPRDQELEGFEDGDQNRRFTRSPDPDGLRNQGSNLADDYADREVKVESFELIPVELNTVPLSTEPNTEKQTKWAVKIIKEWMMEAGYGHRSFEWLPVDQLDTLLQRFYTSLYTKDGIEYSRSTLNCLRSAVNRYLARPPMSRTINILKDKEFQESNKRFDVMVKFMKEVKQLKERLSDEDVMQLYESGELDDNHPRTLQNKVLYDLICHFDLRGRDGLRELKKTSFVLETNSEGKRYVKLASNESDETEEGLLDPFKRQFVMYESGGLLCPVAAFEKYLSKLSPDCVDFFQKPLVYFYEDDAVWYSPRPIGLNTLSTFMSRMSEVAGLSKRYTNRSLWGCCAETLD